MYAIYAYIGVVWGVNVGIQGIHGVSGLCYSCSGIPLLLTSLFHFFIMFHHSRNRPIGLTRVYQSGPVADILLR